MKSHSETPSVLNFIKRREWVNVKREVSYIAYSAVQYNIMSFRDCVLEGGTK